MRNLLSIVFLLASVNCIILAQDTTPPATPQNFRPISYELHIDLTWQPNREPDLAGYKIYKWDGSTFQFLAIIKKYRSFFWEWTGSTSVNHRYKISSFDLSNNESPLSAEVSTLTHQMNDEEFLDMTQRATFRYFWDWADPNSGIARERWQPNESDITNTIGGGGFGVMAILVGIERGFITREQGAARILTITDFLTNTIEKFHGVFPHWFNGTTGKVVKFGIQDGGDIVETSFMIQGLLAARQYFNQTNSIEDQVRNKIKLIWESVDWDFYRNGSTGLYWNWSPTMNFNFSDTFIFHGWNETLITYLLAVASPAHPVLPSVYKSGWANDGSIKYTGPLRYNYDLYVGNKNSFGGPLFFTHYSFLGFDPRGKRDLYTNYFLQNRNQTLINRAYCIDNPKNFAGYNENSWGLTASNSIPGVGYTAHEPGLNDNGTIAPTAALSSMPYFLYEKDNHSLNALKYFYRTYGSKIWGDFGFKDAFNVNSNWYNDDYLAIDQGPIICMIENYRSQLLWKLFMSDPDIQAALPIIHFFPDNDPSDVNEQINIPDEFRLYQNYPNPFNPKTMIKFELHERSFVRMDVYNLLGQKLEELLNEEISPGLHHVEFDGNKLASGVYYFSLKAGQHFDSKKMLLIK